MDRNRTWIGEVKSIATKTVVVTASSRKEATYKLRHASDYQDDIEGIDVNYQLLGPGRIICEDRQRAREQANKREALRG